MKFIFTFLITFNVSLISWGQSVPSELKCDPETRRCTFYNSSERDSDPDSDRDSDRDSDPGPYSDRDFGPPRPGFSREDLEWFDAVEREQRRQYFMSVDRETRRRIQETLNVYGPNIQRMREAFEDLARREAALAENTEDLNEEELRQAYNEALRSYEETSRRVDEFLRQARLEHERLVQEIERTPRPNFRDTVMERLLEIDPSHPGWNSTREAWHRLMDFSSKLRSLKNSEHSEETPLSLKDKGKVLDIASSFIRMGASSYNEDNEELGNDYMHLANATLDQFENVDPNFNARDLLKELPEIPEDEWPYQFQMGEGETAEEQQERTDLKDIYHDYLQFNPVFSFGIQTKDFGLKAIKVADEAYVEGNREIGQLGTRVASTLLDLALSFTPVVNWTKDVYETFIGRSLVTGEDLSLSERTLAAIGTLTGGYGDDVIRYSAKATESGIRKGTQFITKVAKDGIENLKGKLNGLLDTAQELGIKSASSVKKNAPVLRQWDSTRFQKIGIEDASDLNRRAIELGQEPSYLDGTSVIRFKTTTETDHWVRAHGPDNRARPWLMRREDIKGLNATQIKNKYNIPETPTTLSKVTIPEGTRMDVSQVGPNPFGTGSGSIQYKVQMPDGEKLPDTWFTNSEPINDL